MRAGNHRGTFNIKPPTGGAPAGEARFVRRHQTWIPCQDDPPRSSTCFSWRRVLLGSARSFVGIGALKLKGLLSNLAALQRCGRQRLTAPFRQPSQSKPPSSSYNLNPVPTLLPAQTCRDFLRQCFSPFEETLPQSGPTGPKALIIATSSCTRPGIRAGSVHRGAA